MKIGIIYTRPILERCGGPGTYLYNLFEANKHFNKTNDEIVLIHPNEKWFCLATVFYGFFRKFFSFLLRIIKKNVGLKKTIYKLFESCYINYTENYYNKIFKNIDIVVEKSDIDILHFHSYDDLYYYKQNSKSNIRTCLTMHSPQKVGDELENLLKNKFSLSFELKVIKEYVEHLVNISFELADYYIFPSEQCFLLYKGMGYIKDETKTVKYVVTGTFLKETKKEIASSNTDCRTMLFCGRHNEIKGYDLLVNAFPLINKEQINIICAGEINPHIDYPNHKSWKELGWRDDVEEIMESVDVVFVIGKSVYFDLCALEAMSHKCAVIASNVGGNKDLSQLSEGILLFSNGNIDELANIINEVGEMSKEKLDQLKAQNYLAYKQNASASVFISNYYKTMRDLCING